MESARARPRRTGAQQTLILDFELKTTAASALESFDVVLRGAGLTLGFDTTPRPTVGDWSSYSLQLDDSAGWRVATTISENAFDAFEMLPLASEVQLKAVLGELTQLRIRGEFNEGPDTGSLDNLSFAAPD